MKSAEIEMDFREITRLKDYFPPKRWEGRVRTVTHHFCWMNEGKWGFNRREPFLGLVLARLF